MAGHWWPSQGIEAGKGLLLLHLTASNYILYIFRASHQPLCKWTRWTCNTCTCHFPGKSNSIIGQTIVLYWGLGGCNDMTAVPVGGPFCLSRRKEMVNDPDEQVRLALAAPQSHKVNDSLAAFWVTLRWSAQNKNIIFDKQKRILQGFMDPKRTFLYISAFSDSGHF